MIERNYIALIEEQCKNRTPEMQNAIKEQTRLSMHAEILQQKRDELEEKSRNLIIVGTQKLFEKYPELQSLIPTSEAKRDAFLEILLHVHNQSEEYKTITARMKEIPEFCENSTLIDELAKLNYDYFEALCALNDRINSDRKILFTDEYLARMDDLADEGIFMYFQETPDFPLLNKSYDGAFILDSFYFNDCVSLRVLLSRFFQMNGASPSMRRKTEDLGVSIDLMASGCYRAASRNLFALIESEHKKCADAFEGFFEKAKKFKNGLARSKKITKLLGNLNIEWDKGCWQKINAYYQKVVINNGPIDRNAIVHGDYYSDKMDIDKYDAMKLILLWLNLRLIADNLMNLHDMYDSFSAMLPEILKKIDKQEKND